ncbi:glycosyltransferase family 2 protein [Lactococcus chungangensis]|jgi:Glycosyltransferases involved in cell wall biogenesis|uniref:glycosyltransferase family 2 protein n=2 Tax=Pseudolactococcus chungangensis TaxID=451457 RepID=UPI0028D294EF|nr:glycosyltransferase [Lactococcus chungangensis]
MKPLISIVVPVYNVEKYIHECLESILNQSYKNIEVIIVNDGTLDNSIAKIEDLLKDKRTRLISQVNQGLSAARNTGIKAALGEYISFIDSDDKVKSSFIETLYDKANETNADIVRGSFRNFDGNIPEGWITDFNISPSRGTEALRYFLNNNVSFVVWSSLYRTTFLRENRLEFTEGILLEDGDFTTRSYINASVVATSDAPNYYYRVRPGSILTSNNAQRMSQSESKVIQNFINWYESITNHEIKLLIEQSIYAFMRDWTRVLVKNKVKFSAHNSCYVAAKKITKDVLKNRTLFERLKFNAKLFIIECKYH